MQTAAAFAAEFAAIGEALAEAEGASPPLPEERPPERHVDCGSCRACCHIGGIYLTPWDDASQYKTEAGGKILAHRPDGGCIYLSDETGCTIYERRPTACRTFHCGIWYRLSTPEQRDEWRDKAAAIGNRQFGKMLEQGARRASPTTEIVPTSG